MERIKLIDTIDKQSFMDSSTIDGIFSTYIRWLDESESPIPWLDSEIAGWLDWEYYFYHSGDKQISKAYDIVREEIKKYDESQWDYDSKVAMMKMIINKFALSWNKIYSAIVTDYKPLENYDMEQKETPDITHTKTVKQNVTTENKVYGFNSSNAVPQSESVVDGAKLNNEEENKESGTRSLERHGNIGVTTSQQMLQSEIDLRSNYHFMNQIMDDVDSMLCLLVY